MAVFQLGVFPLVIKAVGLTAGQRVGFVLSSLAFVAIPAGKSLSWNYTSLYAVFVATIAIINCSLSAVSGQVVVYMLDREVDPLSFVLV